MRSDKKIPTIALLGLPNVGKSTLFNRLVGKRLAIVLDRPGVTRDCRVVETKLQDISRIVHLIDTPGITTESFHRSDSVLDQVISKRTFETLHAADVLIFLFDGKETNPQKHIAFFNQIRKLGKPTLVAVNKCDNGKNLNAGDFFSIGVDPIFISAEHGIGISDLFEHLAQKLDKLGFPSTISLTQDEFDAEEEDGGEEIHKDSSIINLAIIGRPNVGKSTLINTLLQHNAQIVADVPGVTRDTIDFDWEYGNYRFKLSDTAGIRRKARIDDYLEKISVQKAFESINFAHVCILVVDATELEQGDYGELLQQDMLLLSKVVEEGRCVVIALNKWDLIKDQNALKSKVLMAMKNLLNQVQGVPIIPISAFKQKGIDAMLKAVISLENVWNQRISTAQLNKWLRSMMDTNPPPVQLMHRAKLKYMTQVSSRPPSFVIFCTRVMAIPESYKRFLINQLRQSFNFIGVPIRLQFRQQANPYDPEHPKIKSNRKAKNSARI